MTDQEVADVTDYIRNTWGNSAPVIRDRGVVSEARGRIKTMLAGNAPCAEIEEPEIAKALLEAGTADALKDIKKISSRASMGCFPRSRPRRRAPRTSTSSTA